ASTLEVASTSAARAGIAARAATTTRLVVTRLFAIVRMASLRQISARRVQNARCDQTREQVTPPLAVRRCGEGTGSIGVSVRRGRGGWRGAAASLHHRHPRFRRGIQYAAASRLNTDVSGILDRPVIGE